jgi:hypothetical protein
MRDTATGKAELSTEMDEVKAVAVVVSKARSPSVKKMFESQDEKANSVP